jgi:hypothetical protein
MPVGYIRSLSRKDTEYLLLHELAHIKRGDLVVHSLYMCLQSVYWYNPLLWLVRRRLRHLRELCCDATVAGPLRDRTAEYRRTLVEAARQFLVTGVDYGLGLVGLFEDSNCLIWRINCLEKPIWRYQKMKKLAAITLALILLACVLPMAQAQQESVSETPNAGPALSEDSSAEGVETSQAEQAQSQRLEQLQKAMQALQKQLQQLEMQKQKLEQELHILPHAENKALHTRNPKEQILITQAFVKSDIVKDVLPALSAKAGIPIIVDGTVDGFITCKLEGKPLDTALDIILAGTPYTYKKMPDHYLIYSRAKEAKQKAAKAADKAKQAKDKAAKAKTKAQAEHWQQWAKQMEKWAQGYEQWAESDEFRQWQKEVEKWAQDLARFQASVLSNSGDPAPKPRPMPVMPPMPAMPAPVAPRPVISSSTATSRVSASSSSPARTLLTTGSATVGASSRDIKIEQDKNGKYVATTEMHFVSKVKPGAPFVVRNSTGRIVLRPSKDGKSNVRAVIRGKANTADGARAKAEQVSMHVNSSQERYFLRPITRDGAKWEGLNVDLFVTVPAGIESDLQTNMGSIELYDLEGKIKAVTNMGAIKAVNTTGDLELLTKMGSIEFGAPKDLSAKLSIQTKMGSIKSDLPLEIDQSDMFGKGAQGTVGTGQANMRMTTDMGSITLKWHSTPEDTPVF